MNSNDQESQRRERVFRLLDDMKESGERINADKIARMAKMGKQTVLPFYKEWRMLEDVTEQQKEDIPEDLVRSLQRGIAIWKHELKVSQLEQEEQANREIDELQMTVHLMSEERSALEKTINDLKADNQLLKDTVRKQTSECHQNEKDIAELQARHQGEQQRASTLEQQVENLKKEHVSALSSCETKLEKRHQEQMDHWLKSLDDERQQKRDLEKEISNLNETRLSQERELNSVDHQLESKGYAFIKACEERNGFKTELHLCRKQQEILKEIQSITGISEELPEYIRSLLNTQSAYDNVQNRLNDALDEKVKLESVNKKQEQKLEQTTELEKELNHSKGYIQALEQTLSVNKKPADQQTTEPS